MNWLDELVLVLKRTSLILTGRTFRTLCVIVSDDTPPFAGPVHSALPVMTPAPVADADVTLKVALMLAPGAIGSTNVTDVREVLESTALHRLGTAMLSLTPIKVVPVVFV